MISTLETLKKASKRVVYLGDTPISDYDVPVCLKAHFTSIAACATPFAKAVSMAWRSEEHHVQILKMSFGWTPHRGFAPPILAHRLLGVTKYL